MMGVSHGIMGVTTGMCVGRLLGSDITTQLLLGAVCGCAALAPDIDEPQSLASRRMPYVGMVIAAASIWLIFGGLPKDQTSFGISLGIVLGCTFLCSAAPGIIKSTLGHRGIVHHPWLGLSLLILSGAASAITAIPAIFAFGVGWNVHLMGDAMTISGLPKGKGNPKGRPYEERHGMVAAGSTKSTMKKRWGNGRDRTHILPQAWLFRTGTPNESVAVAIWCAATLALALFFPAGGIPMLLGEVLTYLHAHNPSWFPAHTNVE